MAVEFSEYRGKRKRSFRKRRFPLLRILLLVSLVSGAAALGLFQKVAEVPTDEYDMAVDEVV